MNCNCEADVHWCELCARETAEVLILAEVVTLDFTYDAMNRIVEEEDEENNETRI